MLGDSTMGPSKMKNFSQLDIIMRALSPLEHSSLEAVSEKTLKGAIILWVFL